jgi:hypothetical protein
VCVSISIYIYIYICIYLSIYLENDVIYAQMLRDAERVSNLARERAASLSEKSKEVEELKDQLQQAATAKEVCVCVCARARACAYVYQVRLSECACMYLTFCMQESLGRLATAQAELLVAKTDAAAASHRAAQLAAEEQVCLFLCLCVSGYVLSLCVCLVCLKFVSK